MHIDLDKDAQKMKINICIKFGEKINKKNLEMKNFSKLKWKYFDES